MKKTFLCTALALLSCGVTWGQSTERILWSFGGKNDGSYPSGLISDNAGNLYGATSYGGSSPFLEAGIVFELSPHPDGVWTERILYNFCSKVHGQRCRDGESPSGGRLVFDGQGNLYGTTYNGGNQHCTDDSAGCGVVFKLSPTLGSVAWTETVLYNFCSDFVNNHCLDGSLPDSQLTFDGSGNLYGTTTAGGTGNDGGTVFELSPVGNSWTETVLYGFCAGGDRTFCPDGHEPRAGVIFDKSGNLYGTTELGGAEHSMGLGTVYELSPNGNAWNEKVLIHFIGTDQLAQPMGELSFDSWGNLFGTAFKGESSGVFALTAEEGKERTYLFDGSDGSQPLAGVLIDDENNALFGTASYGGVNEGGVIFKIEKSTGQETVLYRFCQETYCADGASPSGQLLQDPSEDLYGTTMFGGLNNLGIVFEIVR